MGEVWSPESAIINSVISNKCERNYCFIKVTVQFERCFRLMEHISPGGGYFLVKDYWGCAAGWGRIFTTGLTIMGLHF